MRELTIPLQINTKMPLYEQIYQYVKEAIQMGRMSMGEELPSTRALSRHLEVSRATTLLAYEQLQSEGYIESKPGIGYFVASIEAMGEVGLEEKREIDFKGMITEKEYKYDFSPYGVDEILFPVQAFKKLSKEVLVEEGYRLNKVGDARGEEPLRKAITNYLHRSRGVYCSPEQVIVGAGSDFLLLLLNTILRRGDTSTPAIAFESPSYMKAYQLFESLGWKIYTVPMDDKGMDVAKLKEKPVQFAYVMPSHQYPLGIVMPIRRRMELLSWASEEEGRFILEDDYDSEFRYKGKPIPALQGYDKQEKVIYMGTFSKAISPSLRVGYLVLPRSLMAPYEKIKKFLNCPVSKLDQLVLLRFLEDGSFERHLNKTRTLYKNRHDVLLQSLKPLFETVKVSGENAGVHILLHFSKGNEAKLIEKAEKRGIKVYGLSVYENDSTSQMGATILLGYANMGTEKIREAAQILVEIWS